MTNSVTSDTTKTTTEKFQATYKEETLNVVIKDVMFRTNGVGKVFPILAFHETKELKQRGTDAIIFDNIGTLMENGINIGTKLRVKFDEHNVPDVKHIIKLGTKPVEIPTNCNACGRVYTVLESGERKCEYTYCSATKRGFLHKMFALAIPTVKSDFVTSFLDNFPVGGTTGSLDSIAEFKYIWDSIKSRGTQKREQQWLEANKERGSELYEMELEMEKFLTQDKIPCSWFWHICNFPRILENEFHEVSHLDPRKLLDGELKKEYFALSKKTREYIETNFDFVEFLAKFFESYGVKEWTK